MAYLYLGLGTNLGDRKSNLEDALNLINRRVGRIVAQSSFISTAPWGFVSDNEFLNAAVCVETELEPDECLAVTQSIEREMGRRIKSVNGEYHDRIIDIDILIYNNFIVKSEKLVVPHPLMHTRDFVMRPMAEIAPDLIHPVLKKTMMQILAECCSESGR